jgi:DNA-binding MarR family transcriptional regulator
MLARQSEMVGAEVTRGGYAVLRVVDQAGELSMGELARQCWMDPAAAGRQVRALEADGLVERTTAADDGRVTVVRLSRRGRDVYRRLVAIRTEHMSRVLGGWPERDRAELSRLVGCLIDDLLATPFDRD